MAIFLTSISVTSAGLAAGAVPHLKCRQKSCMSLAQAVNSRAQVECSSRSLLLFLLAFLFLPPPLLQGGGGLLLPLSPLLLGTTGRSHSKDLSTREQNWRRKQKGFFAFHESLFPAPRNPPCITLPFMAEPPRSYTEKELYSDPLFSKVFLPPSRLSATYIL